MGEKGEGSGDWVPPCPPPPTWQIIRLTNYKVRVDQSKKYELTKVKCGTSFFSTSRPQYEKKKVRVDQHLKRFA